MELYTQYMEFADSVDECTNEEMLEKCQLGNSSISLKKEYWKLRQSFFTTTDPLEKQKIRTKIIWIHQALNCNIPLKQSVKRFVAPNGLNNITISPDSVIGKDCVIFRNVHIIAETSLDSPNLGSPSIGNSVYIGAGVNIIGNVIIGNNVRIDPNCFINTDIPANSHVVNTGATVVKSDMPLDNIYLNPQNAMQKKFSNITYDYLQNKDDPSLIARKAKPEEIDTIMRLYKDRVAWFKWKKISQWNSYLINHQPDEFLKHVIDGEYYVVEKDDEIIAGFVINEDAKYWDDQSKDSYYLHRVVTKPECRHIGEFIVDESIRLGKEAGKQSLRLECIFSNENLNMAWNNLGFKFVKDIESIYHFSLRELKFSDIED